MFPPLAPVLPVAGGLSPACIRQRPRRGGAHSSYLMPRVRGARSPPAAPCPLSSRSAVAAPSGRLAPFFLPLVVGLYGLALLGARRSVPALVPRRCRGSSLGRAPLRSVFFGCSRSLRPAGAWLPLCSFPLASGLRPLLSVRRGRPFLSPSPPAGAVLRPVAAAPPVGGSLRASVLSRRPLARPSALRAAGLSSGGARSGFLRPRVLRGLCPHTPGNTI